MKNAIITEIESKFLKKDVEKPNIGDTIRVYAKITEGDKERIQGFEGTLIARKGSGVSETFTVRKVVQGVGVERIFQLHSPKVDKVKIIKKGRVRRAKLYYLRDRIGSRSLRIQEAEQATAAPQPQAA